jgi:hypothetical protein
VARFNSRESPHRDSATSRGSGTELTENRTSQTSTPTLWSQGTDMSGLEPQPAEDEEEAMVEETPHSESEYEHSNHE